MKYHYYCHNCNKKIDLVFPMGEAKDFIQCDQCGGRMMQDILGKRIQSHLPLDYIATESDYHSVDYGDDSVIEYATNQY